MFTQFGGLADRADHGVQFGRGARVGGIQGGGGRLGLELQIGLELFLRGVRRGGGLLLAGQFRLSVSDVQFPGEEQGFVRGHCLPDAHAKAGHFRGGE